MHGLLRASALCICALRRPVSHTYAPATRPARLPAGGGAAPGGQKPPAIDFSKQPNDGYFLVARALARLGVRHMFGVIGIPVTQLASGGVQLSISYEMVVGERVEQLLCPVCPEQAPSLQGSQPHKRKALSFPPRPAAFVPFHAAVNSLAVLLCCLPDLCPQPCTAVRLK